MPQRSCSEQGEQLALALEPFLGEATALLALVPGGVPLGLELARRLDIPLDVLITGELVSHEEPRQILGAMAERGDFFLDLMAVRERQVSETTIDLYTDEAFALIARRIGLYRGGEPLPDLYERTLVVVSDGFASISIARVAISTVRRMMPRRILLAVPALPSPFFRELSPLTSAIYTLGTSAALDDGLRARADELAARLDEAAEADLLRQFLFERQRQRRPGAPSARREEEPGEA